MPKAFAVLLALSVALPAGVYAQVDKPRPSPTDRLPAPAEVTAAQQADGSIRVVWKAVDGAVSYSLTRSVPPTPAQQVDLPQSPDTVYIDRDVKPGSTYYYVLSAVNQAGITGLKRSGAPVLAMDTSPPDPPQYVRASQRDRVAEVTWSQSEAGQFRVDVSSGAATAGENWVPQGTRPCCMAGYSLHAVPAGHRLRFRVIAISRTGYVSAPALSNEIVIAATPSADTVGGSAPTDSSGGGPPADSTTVAATNVRPAVVPPAARLKVGASLDVGKKPFFTSLGLQKVRWVSLDDTKATVDSRGKVLGKAVGLTYVVASGLTREGAVASVVQRVDVIRK